MKPGDLARALRRDAAFDPAALDRGKAVLMAAIRQEVESTRRWTIVPQVPYVDVDAALSFLERAFGFREILTARLVTAHGEIDHAMLAIGDGVIGVGPQGHHGAISPKTSGVESQYISVYVDDVDAHYQRAVAAGARIATGLRDYAWGEHPYEAHRTYEALDLEGHRWRFHQLLREVPQSPRRRRRAIREDRAS
jgi:uncharacterized glyoxalase superfamily protein PhnB